LVEGAKTLDEPFEVAGDPAGLGLREHELAD
jgi:hypothetical protein